MSEDKVNTEKDLLVAAKAKGGLATLKTYMKLSGPGWLQSAITLGGGSLSGALFLGVIGGYEFLWVQVMAMVMGVIMLSAISYVTLSTGESPFKSLKNNKVIMSLGPAGTGKTYLAVAAALSMLLEKKVERIILSRPAVEAGERLGFLPGDMKDKIDPYLRPLYDSLYDLLDYDKIQRKIESGAIEIAPLAFMRGRTLKNSFAILDEAQNATRTQIKMFLTRIGENSKLVVNGDPSQIDLPNKNQSGLIESQNILKGIKEIAVINFDHQDVVRHPLVTKIVEAYQKNNNDKG